jgi:thymidylate synthase ThyX
MPNILSAEPLVKLEKSFVTPFKNIIATAKTCYSSGGIVTDEQIKITTDPMSRDVEIVKSIYDAGHHTTFQHASFQFSMSNVSRHFIWSFLHAHPFYNSEQVSQRYVEVKKANFFIPELHGEALAIYNETLAFQMAAYKKLIELLTPLAEREFFKRFPARGGEKVKGKYAKDIKKKSQEIARYVLPVATHAYLYHTISGVTLLRYYKMMNIFDTPTEQRLVVQKMVDELLRADENYKLVLEEPTPLEATPEYKFLAAQHENLTQNVRKEFIREFDESLNGHVSAVTDYKANAERSLADAVREVLGIPRQLMTDDEAIEQALNPAKNTTLAESLVTTTHSKLSRALFHVHYSFRKKLSHAADSQDQRHRMTPASRPILFLTDEPDFITPMLIRQDEAVEKYYNEVMSRTWEQITRLRKLGVSVEFASYLLPNAVSVRFTESADLLNLHHKMGMRLCYLAQEEIWQAAVDEAKAITVIHPRIGKYLLPPCTTRFIAGIRPTCPEGERFCGEKVWRYELDQYHRVI